MTTLMHVPRARQVLAEEDLAGVIGCTPENVFYLSGGLESVGHVIARYATQVFAIATADDPGVPVIVSGFGDAGPIFKICPPGTRAVHFGTFYRYVDPTAELTAHEEHVRSRVVGATLGRTAFDGLVDGLREAGLTSGRVGYDERGMDPSHVARLPEALPGLQLVPAFATLRRIRAVKTAEEIRRLTASLRLTERAIQASVAIAEVGITETDVIREFQRTVIDGGGATGFNEITFGRRAAVGTQFPQDGVLREGDVIRFDVGCRVEGYWSDIARLFAFRGDPPARLTRMYDAIVAGEERAIEHMRPGVTAAEVHRVAIETIRELGRPDFDRHHVGHAVGLEVYDSPSLSPSDRTVLEADMVFEVETPYYEIGFAGVQIEDTVIVRDGGGENITVLPRGIEAVG